MPRGNSDMMGSEASHRVRLRGIVAWDRGMALNSVHLRLGSERIQPVDHVQLTTGGVLEPGVPNCGPRMNPRCHPSRGAPVRGGARRACVSRLRNYRIRALIVAAATSSSQAPADRPVTASSRSKNVGSGTRPALIGSGSPVERHRPNSSAAILVPWTRLAIICQATSRRSPASHGSASRRC